MTLIGTDSSPSRPGERPWATRLAIGILCVHWVVLSWIASGNAPVCDEVAHLTAGIHQWQTGDFWLYRVNPPLVKLMAALPAVLGNPNLDWSRATNGPGVRSEFDVGKDFLAANRPNGPWYHTAGRLLCLPFTVLGGWMCFLWGRSLYGPASGLIACVLWCVSPTVLGWGSTFTPDAAAASLGLLALFNFRQWLNDQNIRSAFLAGLCFGIAQLAKTTWVVLFVLWPCFWVFWAYSRGFNLWKRDVRQLVLILMVGVYTMNVGYGFEQTCQPLGDFEFVSRTLTGREEFGIGNRFQGSMIRSLPVPLPANYVRGIDLQKLDFEKGMKSYLFGEWSDRGWWYYYPVVAALKLPLGVLMLAAGVAFAQFRRHSHMAVFKDELLLVVPAAVVFILVCSQTGFGRYVRYLLPCLPAVWILVSKLWSQAWSKPVRIVRDCCLCWAAVSSLYYLPHSMNYFNELAGGPEGGHRYLLDANVDWGQDLLRLKSWAANNPDKSPVFCATTGFVSPYEIGMDCMWPKKLGEEVGADFTPEPGWYAVSVHELFQDHGYYNYLRKYPRVDRIGYSIWIINVE